MRIASRRFDCQKIDNLRYVRSSAMASQRRHSWENTHLVARQNGSQTDIYPATFKVRAPNAIDLWSMFLLDFASVTYLVADRSRFVLGAPWIRTPGLLLHSHTFGFLRHWFSSLLAAESSAMASIRSTDSFPLGTPAQWIAEGHVTCNIQCSARRCARRMADVRLDTLPQDLPWSMIASRLVCKECDA